MWCDVFVWTAALRSSFRLTASGAEIDRLFASLDADGGGSLDLREVRAALETLLSHADAAAKEDAALMERGEAAAARATELVKAMHATAAYETAQARLEALRTQPAPDAALGAALLSKVGASGETVDKVLEGWACHTEGVEAGQTDKATFVAHALALHVDSAGVGGAALPPLSAEAAGSVFEQLMVTQAVADDKMFARTLGVHMLKRLLPLAKALQAEETRVVNLANGLRRAASKLQAALAL